MRATAQLVKSCSRAGLTVLVLGCVLALGAGRALAQRAMGIDVYSGHGAITWSSVQGAGYSWAWAKATEGIGYTDSEFDHNMKNARAAGVLIGPYHYARYDLGNSGAGEANWFWSVVSPYLRADGSVIMPMLDVEADTTLTKSQVSTWVVDFCQTFTAKAAAAGLTVKMVIYTYPSYADAYLDTSVTHSYLLDMANLNGQNPQSGSPYLSSWPTWTSWQYSWTIKVPGVPGDKNGYCLMDVYNGTLDHLKWNFVIGSPDIVITNSPASLNCLPGANAGFTVVAGPSPLAYQWRKNGGNLRGATTSALTLSRVTTNDTASYTVVVTNAGHAVTSAVAKLTVFEHPTICAQPQSVGLPPGGCTTLSLCATGTAPLYYSWRWNSLSFPPATNASTLSTCLTGNYSCVVSNWAGAVTSEVAVVSIAYEPVITNQPQSVAVRPGESGRFTVGAGSATQPLWYQWHFNNLSFMWATNNASLVAWDVGSYWCAVSNSHSVVTSTVATLSYLTPPVITAQPQSQTNLAGWGTLLVVGVSGSAPLSYQWWWNNQAQGSGTDSTFMACQAGSYWVSVSNATGVSVQSAVALVTLTNPLPGRFEGIKLLEDGTVQLSMSGTPGTNYTLLGTSDWLEWESLETLPSGNGQFQYLDLWATNYPQTFYGLRPGP